MNKKSPVAGGLSKYFKLYDELEIRVRVGKGILHEILLKIRIPLLIVRHRRIAEVVEIHVFDAGRVRIGEPMVDKSGSCLNGSCFGTRKCDEMCGRVSSIIQHRESCDDLAVMTSDIAFYVVRRDGGHRTVVFDVILLVEVFYRRTTECFHKLKIRNDVYGCAGSEKFLPRAP